METITFIVDMQARRECGYIVKTGIQSQILKVLPFPKPQYHILTILH